MSRTRLNVFLERPHAERLAELATQRQVTKSSLVAAALAAYLSPEEQQARELMLVRRLDKLAGQFERLERDQTIQIEALALFIRHHLSITTPIPDKLQEGARAQGRLRFEQFIEQLARHLQRGGSLVREVWEEITPSAVPGASAPTPERQG